MKWATVTLFAQVTLFCAGDAVNKMGRKSDLNHHVSKISASMATLKSSDKAIYR